MSKTGLLKIFMAEIGVKTIDEGITLNQVKPFLQKV